MENLAYRIYELDEVLEQYLNKEGSVVFIGKQESGINNEAENEEPLDTDVLDIQIERDFLDDFDVPFNETVVERNKRIKRYQRIVKFLKQKYEYKCQVCKYSFKMDNGNEYCEAHHIKMLSKDGKQCPENVIILCANHHRMFHYANASVSIGDLINGKRLIKIGKEEFEILF